MNIFRRLISATLLLLGTCAVAFSQRYEPREGWPYLYPEFTSGSLRTSSGTVIQEGHYNICILDGSLHYINNGRVLKADLRTVYSVIIGSEIDNRFFLNRAGEMVEVIAEAGEVYVFRRERLDQIQYEKKDIGYGVSSAIASKHNMTSMSLGGGASVNMDLSTIVDNAFSGEVLPVKESFSFYFKGIEADASKKGVLSIEGIDQDAAKAFIKKEKIRWHKPESLRKVAAFISEQL